MIVTLTPNPSIDRTVVLAGPLQRGAVLRAEGELSHPGGKGVNISRAAVAAGVASRAVFPAHADDPYVAELESLGVQTRPVPPAGPMRVNLTISEPDGTTTKINGAGAAVASDDLQRLAEAVLAEADPTWVVLAGSLPPGAPDDWYADLVRGLAAQGAAIAVDTSDAPLAALVAAARPGAAPTLMKPNAEELASLTGADPEALEADPAQTAAAARSLLDRGVGAVLATLGGAGAVLVDGTGAWHAEPAPITVVSTVGAGDASLFGYLLADLRGQSPQERLALAVAYGSAAASLPGTTTPTPGDVRPDLVRVRSLDLS